MQHTCTHVRIRVCTNKLKWILFQCHTTPQKTDAVPNGLAHTHAHLCMWHICSVYCSLYPPTHTHKPHQPQVFECARQGFVRCVCVCVCVCVCFYFSSCIRRISSNWTYAHMNTQTQKKTHTNTHKTQKKTTTHTHTYTHAHTPEDV
jgi:hypothetical protein